MKCFVYNLEDHEAKEFYLSHNGTVVRGQLGVEIDLKPEYIDVLKDAVVDAQVRDIETNTIKSTKKERYKVVPTGAPEKVEQKEDAKKDNAKKEK